MPPIVCGRDAAAAEPVARDAAAGVVVRRAPAKINLYLHVTGRRGDGYHLLDSLVGFAGVADRVRAAPADELTLTLAGPFGSALAAEPDNLVLRAARALAAAAGVPARAALGLTKRLPPASGIGGGSADAGAALRALVKLWRLDFAPATLAQVALGLGADVPVCLAGRPAQLAGIGEILTPAVRLPPVWLVLANPGVAVATAEVFRRRQPVYSPPAPLEHSPADAMALAAALAERGNDLQPAAIALCPVIGTVLRQLGTLPGSLLARMSGSGATGFALFADAAAAQAAARALRQAQPAWWIVAAPLLR